MARGLRRAFRSAALIALAGCVAEQVAPPVNCPASSFRSSPPLVIAHGGGEGLGPANTIIAMQRSMRVGADVLDADLWMSSDGVIVARHDRELSTTTDGSGFVDEHSWADLRRLDAAARWTGDLSAPTTISRSTRPVTLARDRWSSPPPTPSDERRAAQERGERWCAKSPIGQPPYRDGRFDADGVADAHAHGQAIFTWTVDHPDVLRELAEAGVGGVYTRRPDIARAVFIELAATAGPGVADG